MLNAVSICELGLVKNELKDPSDSQLLHSSGELHNSGVVSVGSSHRSSLAGGMAGALLGASYLMKGAAQATLQQPSQCASADSSSSFVLAPGAPPIGNSSHVPRSNPNSASATSYMPAYEGLVINGVGSPLEAFANVALQQQQQQQPPAVPSPMGSSSSFHELKPQQQSQTRPNIPLSQQQLQYHQMPSLSVQPAPYYAQNAAVPSLFSADSSSLSLHCVPTSLQQKPPQSVSTFYSPQYAQQAAAPPTLHAQPLEPQTVLIHQQLAAQARSTNSPYALSASSTPRPMPAQSPLYTPAVAQLLSQVSQVQFAAPAQHAHFANLSASSAASFASFLPPGTPLNGSSVLPTSSLVPNTSNSSTSSSSHKRSRTQSSVAPQIVNCSINSTQKAQHSAGKRRKYEFNAGGMWKSTTYYSSIIFCLYC